MATNGLLLVSRQFRFSNPVLRRYRIFRVKRRHALKKRSIDVTTKDRRSPILFIYDSTRVAMIDIEDDHHVGNPESRRNVIVRASPKI